MAENLLEKGMVEPAWKEIQRGLTLQPEDSRLLLAKARALLGMRDPRGAMEVLDRLDESSAMGGRIRALKGGALVALKQWDKAIAVLRLALKLNPDPAEAWYYLGLALQQKNLPAEAAAAFRAAFESTPAGRLLTVPAEPPATTRPAARAG